jgi:hypothetical protein
MIAADYGMRRAHLGKLNEDSGELAQLFSSETLAADNKAFFMKVQDVVKGVLKREVFDSIVASLRETTARKVEGDPIQVVEAVSTRYNLTKEEGSGVLRHFIEGGDLSQWGLLNAVTRMSADVESYDRATDLEALGGVLANAKPAEWELISTAKAA